MMRSVVSENTGTPAQKIAPSFPTGSSGRPSDENATACGGWVWTTAAMSDRTRKISEWMKTSLWRGMVPATRSPSRSTIMILSGVISSRPNPGGLHQKAPVAVRQAQCHVSGDVITLVLAHEYAARLDEFFAQSIGHVATLFRALLLWRPAAIPTLHPKRAPARGGHEPATRTRDRATPCRAGDHPARRRAFAPSRRADVIRWHAAGLCREGRPVRFRDGRARDRSAGDASFPVGAGRVRDLDTARRLAARGHHRCRPVPGVDLAAALSCRAV